MASPRHKPTTVRPRNGFSPKWIQNAMRSLGITTKEVLKDITPNLYQTTSTVSNVAVGLVKDIRKGNMSTSRIMRALNDNRYMQYANRAYKNALSDIRTGNLNNKQREGNAISKSMGMDDFDSGFSFGDAGGEDININMDESGTVDAVMKLSSQMETSTVANVKMQKASMDAILAANATMMNLSSNQHSEVISQLSNINSSLAALVEYNNENMSKFIEASMTYYSKIGSAQDAAANSNSKSKVEINDIFANKGTGGINFDKYKSLIKQNLKKTVNDDPNLSMLKMVLDNDQMMDALVSNPVGMASKMILTSAIPKMVTDTLKGFEEAFSNAIPKAMMSITDMQNSNSLFARYFGKIFGLDLSRKSSFDKSRIDKGPIPFDAETKHAITHVITTELSRQTAYLSILAKNVNPNADKEASDNRRFFSYATNSWTNKSGASRNITDEIVNAISNAFNSQNFGKSLDRFADKYEKEEDKAEVRNTIQELFYDLIKSGKKVELPVLLELVSNSGASSQMRADLKKYLISMHSVDKRSFDTANLSLINGTVAYKEAVKRIQENASDYNIQDSLFKDNADIDETIYNIMKWGKENSSARHSVSKQSNAGHTNALNAAESEKVSMYAKVTNGFANFFKTSLTDTRAAIQNLASGIVNSLTSNLSHLGEVAKLKLFGEKNENGARKGGIFSDLANNFTDLSNTIKWHITGKEYTDTSGVKHEANQNSVFGALRNIGNNIKDGIMMKIFGKKKNENGEYVKESDGLFDTIKSGLLSGVNAWKDAFFGIDSNDPNAENLRKEHTKKARDYVKKSVANRTYGAAAGGIVSIGGGILGSLIGGPIGGIGIGAAIGLASRSEKFQNWLFGKKDEETGERAGGLISSNVQKYFKNNKEYMIGSAAIGGIGGAITGGGLLGTLVGGPVAGALMGMASGYVLKSQTFKEFLFGDEEKGKMGLIKSIQYRFTQAFKGKSKKETESMIGPSGMKFLGAGAVGMGTGGLIGLMLGGPLFGALAGLALSAKAAKGTLREFLFGKEDGLTLADGTKVKKQGLFGIVGNYVNANIIKPMSTQVKFIAKDFMATVKHRMLAPFTFLAESIAGSIGQFLADKWNAVKGFTTDIFATTKKLFFKAISPVTSVVGKAMTMATGFLWRNTKFIMSAPGVLITSVLKALNLKKLIGNMPIVKFIRGLGKDIRHAVLSGIKGLFKGVFHLIKAPFSAIKFGAGLVKDAASKVWNSKALTGVRDATRAVGDKIKSTGAFQDWKTWWEGYGRDDDSIIQKIRRNQREYRETQAEIKEERKQNKIHDKNAKIIARATKGQFGDDTDAAREWLRRHKPSVLRQLDGESVDTHNKEARIKKEGSDGDDIPADRLARPGTKLSWKGRILQLLHSINKSTETVARGEAGSDYESFTGEGENAEKREAAEKERKEREKEEAAAKERERWNNLSWYEKLLETSRETGADEDIAEDHIKSNTGWFGQMGLMGKAIKDFAKNDLLGNTRKNIANGFKGFFVDNGKENFIRRWTGGRKFDSTDEALEWLRKNNPRKYAKYIDKFGGAGNVENHFLGGMLGTGLSLVGELGPELLHKDEKGNTKILPHDKTRKLVSGGLKPGDVAAAFNINDKSGDDAETQADEARASRIATLRVKAATGKNSDAEIEEMKAAKMAVIDDNRNDSLELSNDRNYTAAEQLKDRQEAKFREEQLAATRAGADATIETKKSVDGFSSMWSSIFSNKGIVTTGLLALGGWLLTKMPSVVDVVKGIGELGVKIWEHIQGPLMSVLDGIKTSIGGMAKDAAKTEEEGRRTNGNSITEQSGKYVQDIYDGDFLTDEEGRVTANTNLRTRGLYHTSQKAMRFFGKMFPKVAPEAASEVASEGAKKLGTKIKLSPNFKQVKSRSKIKGAGNASFKRVANAVDDKIDDAVKVGVKTVSNAGAKAGTAALEGAAKSKGLGIIKDIIVKGFDFLKKGMSKIGGSKIGKALKFLNPLTIVNRIAKAGANKIAGLVTKLTSRTVADTGIAAMTAGISILIETGIGAVDGLTGAAKLFMVSKSEVTPVMRAISTLFGALASAPIGWQFMLIMQFVDDIFGLNLIKNMATGFYAAVADSADIEDLKKKQDDWEKEYSKYQDEQIQKAFNEQKKSGKIDKSMDYNTFKTNVQGHVDGFDAEYQSFADWNANENASLIDKAGQFVGNAGKALGKGIGAVKDGVVGAAGWVAKTAGNVFNSVGDVASKAWNSKWINHIPGVGLIKAGEDFIKNGGDIGKTMESVMARFAGKVDDILGVFGVNTENLKKGISDVASGIGKFGKDLGEKAAKTWDNFKKGAGEITDGIIKNSVEFGKNIGKTIDGFKSGAAKFFEGVAKGIGDFIKDPGKTISDAASWVGDKVGGIWDSFKSAIGLNQSSSSSGGFGEHNGAVYYSQNDPRWKNTAYGSDANMGNAGCGPTAISMAIQTAKARGIGGMGTDPVSLAGMAQMTGDRDELGTNWNFVGKALAASGMGGTESIKPSAAYIAANAAAGNPVILSGKSKGSSDPYTKAGHYVTAVGMKNGKVLVNDPRGRSYSKAFDPRSLSRATNAAYAVNTGGYGPDSSGLNSNEIAIVKTWLGIVAVVKKAIAQANVGYSQKRWITIEIDGVKQKLRTDCSGFVTACLQYYGVLPQTSYLASGTMGASSGTMRNTGFTHMKWNGVPALRSGDILVTPGKHTEIYSHIEGGKVYVYNCGDDSTCNSPNVSQLSYKEYVDVWRPNTGRPLVQGNKIGTPIVDGVSQGATSGPAAIGDKPQKGWSAALSFIGEAFSRIMNNMFSGNPFEGFTEWANSWGTENAGANDSSAASIASNGTYADLDLNNIPKGTGPAPVFDMNANWVKESISKARADKSGKTIEIGSYKNPDPHAYIGSVDEFIKIAGPINVKLAKKNGYKFPSAIVGQKALESGWGQSKLTALANNFGGIKSTKSWREQGGKTVWFRTGETKDGKSIYYDLQPFKVYDSMVEGLADYYNVVGLPRYEKARAATTPYDYLNELHKAGYGGLDTYAADIMKIVNDRDLGSLDSLMDGADTDIDMDGKKKKKKKSKAPTTKSDLKKSTAKSYKATSTDNITISGMGDGPSRKSIAARTPSSSNVKINYTANIPSSIMAAQSRYVKAIDNNRSIVNVSPELLVYIAEVLTRISVNTGESNVKLDWLKNIKSGGDTKNIYMSPGTPKVKPVAKQSAPMSTPKAEISARQIAQGV